MAAKKIAITGGIGSGKSLALQYVGEMGYPVFSCDEIYKKVILSPEYVTKIKECFPNCVSRNEINRAELASVVFEDPKKLQQLNSISHPLIMWRLLQSMEQCSSEFVFAEVPLLFEGNFENLFDYIIVIKREEQSRIRDLILRDRSNVEKIRKRMQAQFDYDAEESNRLKKNNIFIIENNGSNEALKNILNKAVTIIKQKENVKQ